MVGIISTIVSLAVGVSYGAIAGYLGGRIDNFMMRIVDIIYAIPYILIVIVLLKVFGGTNTPILVTWVPAILTGLLLLLIGIPAAVVLYRNAGELLDRYMVGIPQTIVKFVLGLVQGAIGPVEHRFGCVAALQFGNAKARRDCRLFESSLTSL